MNPLGVSQQFSAQEEEEVLVINAWQRDEDSSIDYRQLGLL